MSGFPPNAPNWEILNEDIRLFQGWHSTWSDLVPALFNRLWEYGTYSQTFSFQPGVGLPGRVFATRKSAREGHIDEADPRMFGLAESPFQWKPLAWWLSLCTVFLRYSKMLAFHSCCFMILPHFVLDLNGSLLFKLKPPVIRVLNWLTYSRAIRCIMVCLILVLQFQNQKIRLYRHSTPVWPVIYLVKKHALRICWEIIYLAPKT